MTKLEIFDDIVSIMEKDSATAKDKGAGAFEKYREQVSEAMPEDSFVLLIQRYLASFYVPCHLFFAKNSARMWTGFRVRRIDDALFVLDAEEHTGLRKGDKIVSLDGRSIPDIASEYADLLFHETNERQLWGDILPLFSEAAIETEYGTKNVPIVLQDLQNRTRRTPYEFQKLNASTVLLRFDDFGADQPIHALIHDHAQEIASAENLIIDVRRNAGGSDTAYMPLLDYCFREWEQIPEDAGDETNFTERNVDLRISLFEEYLKQELPEETRKWLEDEIASQKALRGVGYCRRTDENFDFQIKGTRKPERVYVLTDVYCGSSGDSFVENLRSSGKVTVVGRPTMGILDYSNEAVIHYDDYMFMYPTSRRLALDRGIVMGGHGVPVDVYIPFTEEHLKRDVDLEKVLELIG